MAVKTTELIPGGSRKKKEEEKQTSPVFKNAWQIMQEAKQEEKQKEVKPYESPASLLKVPETKYEPEKYHKGDYFLDTSQWIQVSQRNKLIREYNETRRKNITYMPNTHVDEINQNMMEQGLVPIYSNDSALRPFDEAGYYGRQATKIQREIDEIDRELGYTANQQDRHFSDVEGKRAQRDRLKIKVENGTATQNEYDTYLQLDKEVNDSDYAQQNLKTRREQLSAQLQIANENATVLKLPEKQKQLLEVMYLYDQTNNAGELSVFLENAPLLKKFIDDLSYAANNEKDKAREALMNLGKYSEREVDAIYGAYKNIRNDEEMKKAKEDWDSHAQSHPVAASLGTAFANLPAGVLSAIGAIVHPTERNNMAYQGAAKWVETTRGSVSTLTKDVVKELTGSERVGEFAAMGYQALMSSADSLLASKLGGFGTVLLSVNAAASTYQEALENGLPTENALGTAISAGLFEYVFERLSIENLKFMKKQWAHGKYKEAKAVVESLFKSYVTEESEEVFTDIANEVYDYLFNGGLSKFEMFVADYLDKNRTASRDDAVKAYSEQFGHQLLETGTIGGLSGLFGTAWSIAPYALNGPRQNVDLGRDVRNASDVMGVRDADVVAPIGELLDQGSRAQQQFGKLFGQQTAQTETAQEAVAARETAETGNADGTQTAEVTQARAVEQTENSAGEVVEAQVGTENRSVAEADAKAEGKTAKSESRSEQERSFLGKVRDFAGNLNRDRKVGKAVNRAIYELSESNRAEAERLLREQGYGKRNAVSTSWQIVDYLSGRMEQQDADALLQKNSVVKVVRQLLGNEKLETGKRLFAVKNLLNALDIAKSSGTVEEKQEMLQTAALLTGLHRDALVQYYADDVTDEKRLAAARGKKADVQTVRADMEIDGQTHEVQVGAVKGVEDGDLILTTERDGETVKLSDVDLTAYKGGDEAQEAYENVRSYMTGAEGFSVNMSADAANLLLSIMRDQPDGVDVLDDGYRAYAAGKTHVSFRTFYNRFFSATDRALQSDRREMQEGRLRASKAVLLTMWEAGRREAERKPGAVRIGTQPVTETQVDEMVVMDAYAKEYGRTIVFTDALYSRLNSDNADLAGIFDESGKTVIVPMEANLFGTGKTGNLLLLAADHEFTHKLATGTEVERVLYAGLRDRAIAALKKQVGEEGYQQIYDQRYEAYRAELSEEDAKAAIEEEITAQYFGAMHERSFCEAEVQKDPGFWAKVKELFQKLVDQIRRKLEQLAKKDLVVKAAMEAKIYDVQAAVNLLEGAMRVAQEQAVAEEAEASEAENKKTAEAVERYLRVNNNNNTQSWLLEESKDIFSPKKGETKRLSEYKNDAKGFFSLMQNITLRIFDNDGNPISINAEFKGKFLYSHNSDYLFNNHPLLYEAKMRSLPSMEDLINNCRVSYYTKDEKSHKNYVGFYHYKGDAAIIVRDKKFYFTYDAVVGVTKTGERGMYDFKVPGDYEDKKIETGSWEQSPNIKTPISNSYYTQKKGDVNTNSKDQEKNSRVLGMTDSDISYERIFALRDELRDAEKEIRAFEESDEFRQQNDTLAAALQTEDITGAIEVYKKWAEESGYDAMREKVASLRDELNRLQNAVKDREQKEAEEKEQAAITKSGLTEADYFRRLATRSFGTTTDFREAGYLLPNGKMLNFTGEKGRHYGSRGQDHRAIGIIYETTQGSAAMNRFVNAGNIRVIAETPGVNLYAKAEPTREQYNMIRDMARRFADREFFGIDLSDENGRNVGSLIYEGKINAERIVNDLKHYFATGEIREQSDVDRFRYSRVLGAEAAEYAEDVKVGNSLNRARIDLLEEMAKDIGVYDEDFAELTAGQARSLARKYNLSGNETHVKEIATKLLEIRKELKGGASLTNALYALYEIAKDEAAGAGEWMDADDGTVQDYKKWMRGKSIFVSEEDLNEIAENYGGRAALRRATFGKFTLTPNKEKGASGGLDAFWDELLEQHFGFTETTDNSERVRQMLDMWGRGDRVWVYDSDAINAGETLEETATDYAIKMLADLMNAGRKLSRTESEKMDRLNLLGEELEKQRDAGIHDADRRLEAEYRQKLDALQNSDKDLLDVEKEAKELETQRRIDAIRKAYEARIETLQRNQRENVQRQGLLRDIHRNMSSLGKLIVNAKDTEHVPEALRTAVLAFTARFAKGDRNVFTAAMARDLQHAYQAIYAETDENGAFNELSAGADDDIMNAINELVNAIETDRDGQIMTGLLDLKQLRQVATISEHILSVVKNANTIFIDGKRHKISELGERAIKEINEKRRNALQKKLAGKTAYDFLTGDMLTPIYFFKEKLGGAFGELYEDFRNGQDLWYRRCEAGKDAIAAAQEKYHYKDWQKEKKRFTFENAMTPVNGRRFDAYLTVDDMLQIYATYRRETENGQESQHLTGGIVLSKRVETFADRVHRWLKRDAGEKSEKGKGKNAEKTKELVAEVMRRAENEKYDITYEQILEVINSLTEEQKAYADEIVKFMSTTTSGWGNEASMDLYGYRKFRERYYFPFQSAENYLYQKLGTTNDARLKSAGFSKKLVHGAKTPLVISGFTEVAATHIQEMAMYASFLNPIENMTRVFNYQQKEAVEKTGGDGETIDATEVVGAVKASLGAVYGGQAAAYINNFITAVNGGMRSDRIDNIWNKGTSLFKKGAVMANASVVIQQPTALLRAMALINPVYFAGITSPGTFVLRGADYKNMMEHSEIAGIKEMGGFDTGMGASAVEWMLNKKSIPQKIGDLAGKGAEWADAVTWVNIWNAVRRETRAKYKDVEVGSDEYYEICRKRFRDIADYTQVYDSTLSKSALMSSKSSLTKMVTAFMAEPTLSFNLLTQSGKGRTIHKGRALIAFVANTIVNAAFQSIVGAWRKKEEDETYLEKYVRTFSGNLLGSKDVWFLDSALSPVTMIPWVKDLLSIAQKYDVERSDVSVFSDLIGAVIDFGDSFKDGGPTKDDILALAGAVSAFGPVPIKNAVRDVQGILRTVKVWKEDTVHSTMESVREAFLEGLGFEKEKAENAYDAIKNGDAEAIKRLTLPDEGKIAGFEEEGYSHEDAVKMAERAAENAFHATVKKGLTAYDQRIQEAAESRLNGDYANYETLIGQIVKDGFDRNDVLGAVETLTDKLREAAEEKKFEDETPKDKNFYKKADMDAALERGNVKDVAMLWDRMAEQGTKDSTLIGYVKPFFLAALGVDKSKADAYRKLFLDQGIEEDNVDGWARTYAEQIYEESLDREKTLGILTEYAGMERAAAAQRIDYWNYKILNPDGKLDLDRYKIYDAKFKAIGLSAAQYEMYWLATKDLAADKDAAGNSISGSKKKKIVAAINRLPFSRKQKDDLYRLNEYAEKDLPNMPWNR